MKTLTAGDLKKILNNISDDVEIVLIDENIPTHIVRITQVGYLTSEYEEYDALGFASLSNIEEITNLCKNYLFDGRDINEIKEIS